MSRAAANTPEGRRASEKWKRTMQQKYGGASNFMKGIGAIGGKNGRGPDYGGGFCNRELARKAGAKGGSISKRTKTHYSEIWDKELPRIIAMIKEDKSDVEIARATNISIGALKTRLKKAGLR